LSFVTCCCFSQPAPAEGKPKTGENKYNSPKSKSEKTAAPTIIKLTRQQLMNAATFSDLIESIPSSCTVFSCLLTVNNSSGTVELPHNGNTIHSDLKSRFPDCQWIIIENLKSNCHRAHKANYKIIVY
jgi:hypothetical protein